MRALLIVYDNDSYIHWFPQGLAYIASALRNAGHDVIIYDQALNHHQETHLTEYLDNNNFDIVCMSSIAGYYQYKKLLAISEAINKSKNRNGFYYIIGGHASSPEPEHFLLKTQADFAVIGEGEETIIELINAIKSKTLLSKVKGIAYRNNNAVTVNERRPLIKDIDSIPYPAYDLFDMNYYRLLRMPHCTNKDFVMPMLSGRGCTFKCNFCYRMDKGFRPRSPESIIQEIKHLQKNYGITYIAFSDELLMSSEARTTEICNAFIEERLNIKWDCNGRLNYATPSVLQLMKEAGCVFINYGIESVDNTVLKNMNKHLTVEQITKGVENTLNSGISPGLNIIWGNMGDTRETLMKGVKFLNNYSDNSQMRTIRPVTPYPGSELYHYAIKKGLIKDCEDFYKKHLNSDLATVQFTDLLDEEFHKALFSANSLLIDEYFNRQSIKFQSQAEQLYINHDTSFRGFRQS